MSKTAQYIDISLKKLRLVTCILWSLCLPAQAETPPLSMPDIPIPPGMELPSAKPTTTASTTAPMLAAPPMPGAGDKISLAPGSLIAPVGTVNADSPTNNAQTAGVFSPPPLPPPGASQQASDVAPEKKLVNAPNGIIFPPSKVKSKTGIEFPTTALPEIMIEGKRYKTWETKLKPTAQPPLATRYNYRRQILPDVISRKSYDRDNQHLPVADYVEDYDHLFLESAANNDLNATRALLNSGRNINLRNADGDTVLILALRHGAVDTARLLIARGASAALPGADGRTAYDVAQGMNLSAILPPPAASPIVYSRR